MIRGLEQEKRHVHGAIFELLNIIEKHGTGASVALVLSFIKGQNALICLDY